MSTSQPELISGNNLSFVWAEVFLRAFDAPGGVASPQVVSIEISNNVPTECMDIRRALDLALCRLNKFSSSVSATTIFPYKYWVQAGRPHCSELSKWYLTQFLPRLKARGKTNCYGTYFERMVAFQGAKGQDGKPTLHIKNQLEHIVLDWTKDRKHPKRPRQSALQIACFDPAKDHTGQSVRGFPCLQQVSLSYDDNGNMALSAYYPTQYVFDRAYGNYHGLCHLGEFMAHEMGLKLVRLNCYIGRPELGTVSKSQVHDLADVLRGIRGASSS